MSTRASPIAAIVVSTAAVALLGLAGDGVKVVGEIPAGLPPIALPAFDAKLWASLLPAAALLSVIGFVESMSVAQTLAAKRRQRLDPDQELIGLGAANVAAAFSGGYPVTGGFARSVVNFDAGAQTPMAGVFTAAGIAATTVFLTPLIPRPAPMRCWRRPSSSPCSRSSTLRAIRRTWAYSKSDFAAMALTIAVVLGVGVVTGLVAGVSLSLLLFLWRTSRPHMAIVGQVPGHRALPQYRPPPRHRQRPGSERARRREPLLRQRPFSRRPDLRPRRRAAEPRTRRACLPGGQLHRRQRAGKPGDDRRPAQGRWACDFTSPRSRARSPIASPDPTS